MRFLITLLVVAAFAATPLLRAADPTPAPSPTAAATPAKKHHTKKSKAAAAAADANATPAAAVSAAAPAPAPAATPAAKTHQTPQPLAQQAAGGGNGMVWVNAESHVYHKEGSKWYGKTKNGKYISEADAIKEGDHAAKNEK